MARILKSRNIEADTAFSGAEARQRVAEAEYGVVLLDVRLPDEPGYGPLGALRALQPDIAGGILAGVEEALHLLEGINVDVKSFLEETLFHANDALGVRAPVMVH